MSALTTLTAAPPLPAAVAYFEAQAVTHARTLPIPDAQRFLLGMLESVSTDAFPQTRVAYRNLCFAIDQLEVIASGQLKLGIYSQRQETYRALVWRAPVSAAPPLPLPPARSGRKICRRIIAAPS